MRTWIFTLALACGCSTTPPPAPVAAAAEPAPAPRVSDALPTPPGVVEWDGAAELPSALHGRVLETIYTGGYVYMRVHLEEPEVLLWTAAPEAEVPLGSRVHLDKSMVMHDFTSKTLKRTFPVLLFTTMPEPPEPPGDAPAERHAVEDEGDVVEL